LISDLVYDMTKYVKDHPGGADALLGTAGIDATSAYEDVGHSEDAREILNSFLVGSLPQDEGPARSSSPYTTVRVIRKGQEQPQEAASQHRKPLALLAAGACLVLAVRLAVTIERHGSLSKLVLFRSSGEGGFFNGVLVATAVFATLSAITFRRVTKAFAMSSGFLKYSPHIKATANAPLHQPAGFLNPREYRKLPLVKKHQLSPTVLRLTFALPTPSTVLGLPIGQHVAIRASVGDQIVTRSFTPVSNNSDLGQLELVIKIYQDGLLTGKYLSSLQIGNQVEFRGPKGAMRYRRGLTKSIGMVAGGTGITPMFQLIRAACEDREDVTQISLVYANRSEEEILLRRELDRFAMLYPKNFKVWYMLDHPPANWQYGSGYVTKDVLTEKLPDASDDTKILLCGPPPMVNATRKNLIDLGFKTSAAVSKMTDQIFVF
jgi:cytochrome-b5 reductase